LDIGIGLTYEEVEDVAPTLLSGFPRDTSTFSISVDFDSVATASAYWLEVDRQRHRQLLVGAKGKP
jgi:hypothetical protein